MDSNKKLYLYSGLAIALSVVAYVVITRKKKLDTDPSVIIQPDVTTSTGSVLSAEQTIVDATLAQTLLLPLPQIKSKLVGTNVYSKVDNVNPRQTPNVNNGWLVNNGVGGRITQKDTFIGKITDVVNDSGLLKNNSGNVYKWFKIKPSAEAIKQIKDDSNILIPTKTNSFYVREDVVKLK